MSDAIALAARKPVPTDKPVVFVRFQPETKAALEQAAVKDGRSIANLLEMIATDWLRERGYHIVPMRVAPRRPRK